MKRIIIIAILLSILIPINSYTQPSYSNKNIYITDQLSPEIMKESFLYAVKGRDSLYVDKYNFNPVTVHDSIKLKPAVIFMFGGGFYTGTRTSKYYTRYFEFLAKKGYHVFSIDYRLGLKKFQEEKRAKAIEEGKKPKRVKALEFVKIFDKAVDMAVEDLFTATNYIITRSVEWNIDTSVIIASGSSAGAITVLQGEYYLSNKNKEIINVLPANFKYAGIISFAGAVFNYKSKLKWDMRPSPIALFHGDSDPTVPYNRIWTPIGSFNGSKRIVGTLKKIKAPYLFCTYHKEDHKIAVAPMINALDDISMFLDEFVLNKGNFEIDIITTDLRRIEELENSSETKAFTKSQYRKKLSQF